MIVPVRVPSIGQIELFEIMKCLPIQIVYEDTFLYLIYIDHNIRAKSKVL